MPKIAVSERAYTALRRHAFSELAGVGERLGDGSMEIAISGRLHDELLAGCFPVKLSAPASCAICRRAGSCAAPDSTIHCKAVRFHRAHQIAAAWNFSL